MEFADEQGIIKQKNLEKRTESVPAKSKPAPKTVCKTEKLVDKERKVLEKNLSTRSRNQCF